MKKYLLFILIIIVVGGFIYLLTMQPAQAPTGQTVNSVNLETNNQVTLPANNSVPGNTNVNVPADHVSIISEPISNALARITKKPFGIYITPQNSPVSPEHFKGYHTGVDFETTPEEQNVDVPIYAICSGTLSLKKYATGYGGVAVESCKINAADVTVVYGHLRLSSITAKAGQTLKAGERIGFLGTGYSTETDGERKHLHLGIHKGTGIVLLGYVQNKADLSAWIDAETLLK